MSSPSPSKAFNTSSSDEKSTAMLIDLLEIARRHDAVDVESGLVPEDRVVATLNDSIHALERLSVASLRRVMAIAAPNNMTYVAAVCRRRPLFSANAYGIVFPVLLAVTKYANPNIIATYAEPVLLALVQLTATKIPSAVKKLARVAVRNVSRCVGSRIFAGQNFASDLSVWIAWQLEPLSDRIDENAPDQAQCLRDDRDLAITAFLDRMCRAHGDFVYDDIITTLGMSRDELTPSQLIVADAYLARVAVLRGQPVPESATAVSLSPLRASEERRSPSNGREPSPSTASGSVASDSVRAFLEERMAEYNDESAALMTKLDEEDRLREVLLALLDAEEARTATLLDQCDVANGGPGERAVVQQLLSRAADASVKANKIRSSGAADAEDFANALAADA